MEAFLEEACLGEAFLQEVFFAGGLSVGGFFAGGLFPGRPFWSYPPITPIFIVNSFSTIKMRKLTIKQNLISLELADL